MHWKRKAKIQNIISLLPSAVSYEAYYLLQRHFGGLRKPDPVSRLTAGIETWKRIQEQNYIPLNKVFLEVGTGRVPVIPLAYWLMGAKKTITIDLNPYLKEDLVKESLQYISDNEEKIMNLFGSLIDKVRFDELLKLSRGARFSIPEFFELCHINYVAPCDATNSNLADKSIDFHTSYTVFEHIPTDVLERILEEGNRIVTNNGLFIHRIDYSDHFSHSDKNISAINFLKYSNREWDRYADNRYMYMNRMRHDDYMNLFVSVGHNIVDSQVSVNLHVQDLLKDGNLQLNNRFSSKPDDVLSITGAWIISENIGLEGTARIS